MGVVWAARHLTLETDVAVKLIRPERVARDPALLARFEREARATARIAHPHVVQIMDYGTVDEAVPYIVMELLRGFSLAELLESGGRLSFATAGALVAQVGSALEAAHASGVVHRDVKPHNVLITMVGAKGPPQTPPVTEGSRGYPLFVKVLDFGVAKMLGDDQVPGASAALTETGTVIGSPPYMSPEQLEGSRDVDLRSDLWSLGVIVYESLTGALPFQGGSFVAVGAAVLKGKYRPASELVANLPAAIDDWFARALCVDPAGRFASARAMVEAFQALDVPPTEEAAEEVVLAPMPEPRAPAESEPAAGGTVSHAPLAKRPLADTRGRRRRLLAGIAAGVALACAGLAALRARTARSAGCPAGMVLVDGATFDMGSAAAPDTPRDETPPHRVTVRPFCLDVTEVTVAAYARCPDCVLDRTVAFERDTPRGVTFQSQFCNGPDAPDHPVNCVDWNQAEHYCSASGKRLPTEAEWELAARGAEGRTYPWGSAPPTRERLNACGAECVRMLSERLVTAGNAPSTDTPMYDDDDSAPATAPVGSFPGGDTPAGVRDLAGNVWEWTASRYCPYGEACDESHRVLRGGGWDTVTPLDVRAARRYPSAPTARGKSIGFRCAGTP